MSDPEEHTTMMQRARAHLSEVVSFMPAASNAAYLEALAQCPHLVETESNPEVFLQFENFNYWSAAGRLVTYWRKRKEYFGDRAFLPMDLSGEGAMSEEDLKPMAAGCVTMIPGSNIIVHDRTSADNAGDTETRLRRRFFILQTLICPCARSGKGLRMFIYGFEISNVLRKLNAELKALLTDAFPIPSLEEAHIIFVKERNQTLWQYLLPRGLEQAAGLMPNIKVHNFDSVAQIAEGLSCYGVSRDHLPPEFGGTYNIESSSFVLENKLPLSQVKNQKTINFLSSLRAELDKAGALFNTTDVEKHDAVRRHVAHQGTEGKGSLELLLDYFIRKAPDLPDVADVDSLNPLTPFDPIFPCDPTDSSYRDRSPSVPLYVESDAKILTEYQCLVRQQIEFFEATSDDVTSSIRGRNKAIVLGQVGVRCSHCAHLPRQKRAIAATYYPTKLDGIYQISQNLARKHLIGSCPFVPYACKRRLTNLCESKSATGTGKSYWAETAATCGVCEVDSVLRFSST